MELKILNGDYVPSEIGGFETVSGYEEKLARILYKLSCRKGGFAPDAKLGSMLHTLLREKRGNREALARKYILEALEDEKDVVMTALSVSDMEGGVVITADFDYIGEKMQINYAIGDER